MKFFCIVILLLSGIIRATAQEEGTKFENLSFQEALSKAKTTGKPLFVDCYTKTCGPCKYMVKNIFPLKVCGDYFNANYVCIMKDMEEGDGLVIARKYNLQMYPTYLILNADGVEICRLTGGVSSPEEDFVGKVKEKREMAELNERYRSGERGENFLKTYGERLSKNDNEQLQVVMGEIFPALGIDELCRKENWVLICTHLNKVSNPLFRYLLDHRLEFSRKLGKKEVEMKLLKTYAEEFRIFRMVDIDFESRLADLQLLIKDGSAGARVLYDRIWVYDMVSHQKKERWPELMDLLEKGLYRLPLPEERLAVIREMRGIGRWATSEQLARLRTTFVKLHKNLPASAEKLLQDLLK